MTERGRAGTRALAITAAAILALAAVACGFGLPQPPPCTICLTPLRELRLGSAVNDVQWSPDGSMIATASEDGTAQVWDAATGERLKQFSQLGPMRAARWSPDGSRLAVSGDDGPVRVYDVSDGTVLVAFDAYSGGNLFADWSPDGTMLATIDDNGVATTWNAATGAIVSSITRLGGQENTLAWSPVGTRLAVAGFSVEIWDESTGQRVRLGPEGHNSVLWSPDGTRLLASGVLYDATGAQLSQWQDALAGPAIAWSGDQPEALSIDPNSGTVVDSVTGEPANVMPGQAGWSPDGSLLAVVEWNRDTVAIWPSSSTGSAGTGSASPDVGR